MRKENIYKFLYAVSIFLIIGFVIRISVDLIKYDEMNNSAPFYAFIIIREIEFVVPSIICFVVGKIINKKFVKGGNR